ncbi:MAG TPA: ATP-binding protein [Bryobacteraceae bacterium]|jgi:two-component system phosphate regulon sensor histidine kinase PhoR|nr:ATP-binding protein [Bryobacteraceae bacterium]
MRTRIVRRFLWSAFVLFAIALFGVDLYVSRITTNNQIEDLRASLTTQARILAIGLPAANMHLDSWVKAAAAQTGARAVVLDRDGAALADSEPSAAGDVLSVSVPAELVPAATLRLSRSLDSIHARADALRVRLFAASALSLALAAGLAFIFVESFSRQIASLRAYSERLLDPQISEQELPSGDDDLGALAQSLRRTVPRIGALLESLKLEGARREAILASMVEGVLAVDKDLRVTFCNNSFARTVGARTPVSPGMQLLELVRDPALIEIMTDTLSTGERVERRITLAAADQHSFEVLAGPLAGPSTRGALAILHDVTELERLERVRKDFVANVSHELRTPLAAIRGYAETLLDGALEDHENNHRFVEIIQAQATRLTNIASDLLTISELESNLAAPSPKPISIRSALESALRTVESGARIRSVRLLCEKVDDVQVLGNELQLEQVFVNLLDNAVKFNRPNGEVRVETQCTDGTAQITISDTGIGIPSEDLPRVFERFYRVDKARSREMGGTGLGLSIVKHVIEQMGGTVVVQSQVGQGSRFTLTVPRFFSSSVL